MFDIFMMKDVENLMQKDYCVLCWGIKKFSRGRWLGYYYWYCRMDWNEYGELHYKEKSQKRKLKDSIPKLIFIGTDKKVEFEVFCGSPHYSWQKRWGISSVFIILKYVIECRTFDYFRFFIHFLFFPFFVFIFS